MTAIASDPIWALCEEHRQALEDTHHQAHDEPRGTKRSATAAMDADHFNHLVDSVVQRLLTINIHGNPLLHNLTPQAPQQMVSSAIHHIQPCQNSSDDPVMTILSPVLSAPRTTTLQAAAPTYTAGIGPVPSSGSGYMSQTASSTSCQDTMGICHLSDPHDIADRQQRLGFVPIISSRISLCRLPWGCASLTSRALSSVLEHGPNPACYILLTVAQTRFPLLTVTETP